MDTDPGRVVATLAELSAGALRALIDAAYKAGQITTRQASAADRLQRLPISFVADVNIDLYQCHERQESQQRVNDIKWRSLHAPVAATEYGGPHAKFVNKV